MKNNDVPKYIKKIKCDEKKNVAHIRAVNWTQKTCMCTLVLAFTVPQQQK